MASKRSLRVLNRLAEQGRTAFTTTEVRSALQISPQATSTCSAVSSSRVWSVE